MKNTLIKTDGSETALRDGELSLKEMYEAIGCDMVELVTLSETERLWCDEEGLLKNDFVINNKASRLYQKAYESDDPAMAGTLKIVGNAILSVGRESSEE